MAGIHQTPVSPHPESGRESKAAQCEARAMWDSVGLLLPAGQPEGEGWKEQCRFLWLPPQQQLAEAGVGAL